ncbi:MAG: glycosyltransferase [Candidatus Nezhaarchaeales archaeon]
MGARVSNEMGKRNLSSDLVFVSALPPDKGRLSEYADAVLREIEGSMNLTVEVFTDASAPSFGRILPRPIWRPNNALSVIKLWLAIIKSKTRLFHFNLHMAVFGRGRLPNLLGLLSPLIARLSGKKVMVTLHNLPAAMKLESIRLKTSILDRLGLWVAAFAIVKAAHVLVVTMKQYVELAKQKYGAKRVEWVPHGCWFTAERPVWKWRNRGKVLFLGYIGPYKDLEALAKAMEIISEKRPVTLLVAGTPHPNFAREALEEVGRLKGCSFIRFLGRVPDRELPRLIEKVDLVVLPYKTSTGTSGVVHLLSALGVPFVASDTPELRELELEGAGILISGLEPKYLAEAILKVMEDKELAERLSARSRRYAEERPWKEIAKRYVQMYGWLSASP